MKRYWIFLFIVAVTIAAAYVVKEGYYPIAMVGNTLVSARDFSKQFEAAKIYQRRAEVIYGSSTLSAADLEETVFEGLIESTLIHTAVEKEIGKETPRVVRDRTEVFLKDSELLTAAETVYGITKEEFQRMVLIPQVEREILTGKLFLRGMGLTEWLARAKQEEKITLLVPGFEWKEGVIVKKEKR